MSYLGEKIPKLGFGLMRLPMLDKEVDIEQTKKMVDRFLESGFTYFDTAYGYIGGKSEEAIKVCLVDRYPRDKFYLATKLPAWAGAKTADEAKEMFYTSLRRTGAGYFDFYLLHNLGDKRTEAFDQFGIWDFARELKEKGLIKHLGFSMHSTPEELDKVLTAHPETEFVQLQINYADWDDKSVQARASYEVARKHNKPVIIMEPVKGGTLAKLPAEAEKIFRTANADASLPSWAIRYAASLPGLITVLSGMSDMAQMEDNLSFMKDFKPLDESERAAVEKVREYLASIPQIPCTGCRYCVKGCPVNMNIPEIFGAMNKLSVFNDEAGAKGSYEWATHEGTFAKDCVACGQCESVCPQHISIIYELKRASEKFDN